MDTLKMISLVGLSMISFWVYLSIKRARNMPRRHAADRLFEAFMDELHGLHDTKEDPYKILKTALRRHESAYLHFRTHLNGKILRQFDEAWREYSRSLEIPASFSPETCCSRGNGTSPEEGRQLARRKILAFLSLAKKYSHLPPR